MIDFKTYDEQIAILQNRGMIISDIQTAKDYLSRHNYYNIINGYKDIFIQKGVQPEKYITVVTFDELYSIHQLDKNLRFNLAHILTLVERTTKSILAYEFAKANKNNAIDFYLDIANYDSNHTLLASELIRKLNNELIYALSKSNPMICHYKTKYNFVPIWVFINIISFGTLSKMYECLPSNVRDAVAIQIAQIYGSKLFADDIQNALNVLVLLRNKCAHDQRIYDFNTYPINIKPGKFITKYLNNTSNVQSLFGSLGSLSLFIKPSEFNHLVKVLKISIKNTLLQIHSIPTQALLDKMGVPQSFLL